MANPYYDTNILILKVELVFYGSPYFVFVKYFSLYEEIATKTNSFLELLHVYSYWYELLYFKNLGYHCEYSLTHYALYQFQIL